MEGITEIELSKQIDRIAAVLGSSGMWSPTTSRVGLGTLVAHPDRSRLLQRPTILGR